MSSDLVFVGGASRSDTQVLARLLGRHPRFAEVPIEARFHCDEGGMPDLLAGRVKPEGFLDKLREVWWHRVRADGQPRGLYNFLTRRQLDAVVERFEDDYRSDPEATCRQLFVDLLGPLAEEEEKPGLVEMSANNLAAARSLRRLFPDAHLVHAVRDGREAAAAVAAAGGGPGTVLEGIDWWADRLRAIEAAVGGEGGPGPLSPSELCVVVLDELLRGDREEAYERLLDFLAIDDDPGLQEFFELRMPWRAANSVSWGEGLGRLERRRVERKYEATLVELERQGNHVARPLVHAYERLG
jgi:hypothetical protein